jgi:hypothetical protein
VRRSTPRETISTEDAVEALKRSGYLLENRIARGLDEFATHLSVNVVFSDPETNQRRGLDAYCFRSEVSDTREFFSASAHLLIECVNNPQPIAFFKPARKSTHYPILAARPAWLGPRPIEESIGIEGFHSSFKVPVATNYCTFVAKKSDEWMVIHADEQHREFSTLAMLAQLTREKQLKMLDEYSRPQDAIQFCGIELIYPILVVEGILFEVDQNSKGVLKLESIDRIRYCRNQIWKGRRRYCPIDVVTEKFFPQVLKLIRTDCRRMLRRLEARSDEILEAAREEQHSGDSRSVDEDLLP